MHSLIKEYPSCVSDDDDENMMRRMMIATMMMIKTVTAVKIMINSD